jgi:hypothetical protein
MMTLIALTWEDGIILTLNLTSVTLAIVALAGSWSE